MRSTPLWTSIATLLASALGGAHGDLANIPDDGGEPSSVVPLPTAKAVEQYAFAGGSDAEIAARFLIDELSLRRRFADVLRAARAMRQLTLRKRQFDLARDGNAAMLTWLGRNELGQSLNPTKPGEPEPELEEKAV